MKGTRQKILLVDSDKENRKILIEMLGEDYEIVETESAGKALDFLGENHLELEMVLLDVEMEAGIDGFDFLTIMNTKNWIETIPVIIISDDTTPYFMRRAYGLGASDYISRPFDSVIVKRRIENIISLNQKQKKIAGMLIEKVYESEKNANMLANILGNVAEFRNRLGSDHVLNMGLITKILLEALNKKSDKYNFDYNDIILISTASEIHDIGKLTIPEEIVNKKGKLTKEEFEIMKSHSIAGQYILEEMGKFQDEPFIKIAKDICRWHHERYDGGGYPDGLKGDEIPISAQVVSVAEVYDVLTSERAYKNAVDTDKAMEMICNGECGVFNPDIVECLKENVSYINEKLNKNPLTRNVKTDILRSVEQECGQDTVCFFEEMLTKYKD